MSWPEAFVAVGAMACLTWLISVICAARQMRKMTDNDKPSPRPPFPSHTMWTTTRTERPKR